MPSISFRHAARPARWAVALTLLGLAGCAGVQSLVGPRPAELAEQAQSRLEQQQYGQASVLYQRAAQRAAEPQRSGYYLDAGRAAVQAGDSDLALRLLGHSKADSLSTEEQAAKALATLRARIAGLPPEQALAKVEPPDSSASPQLAASTWGLRAELLFNNDRLLEGVYALVQRQVWLLEDKAIQQNSRRIWQALQDASPDQYQPESGTSLDRVTRAWLELAGIAKQSWQRRQQRESALSDWAQRYPGHPATRSILPQQLDYTPDIPKTAARPDGESGAVGLALPLSGDLEAPAHVILNGFLAAYYQQSAPRPTLHIYDTASSSVSNSVLQRATADGVGVLVGPLAKDAVASLSDQKDVPLPVLALNYADTGDTFPGFYQFGLSPEDEARAAARRAVSNDRLNGLALVPKGDWGSRVLDALRDSLSKTGGELLDYARFDPERNDHAQPIKRVLDYDGSSRGSDKADFIFLAARPEDARLLRTQLRFYHATDLPVLATSHVYSERSEAGANSDLNGLKFADIPWILNTRNADARKQRLSQNWDTADGDHARLFAMGLDAWALGSRLSDDDSRPGTLFSGATGQLYLQPDGQIRRRLDWAEFANGRPEPLPTRDTIVLPSREHADSRSDDAPQPGSDANGRAKPSDRQPD